MKWQRTAVTMDGDFKTRAEDGKRYIEGYFAKFGTRYPLWDKAWETIDRGAFNLERDTDVRALTNHDTTLVLGRTTAGTAVLRVDDIGLWGRIELNERDQDAVNAYERVNRRDVTQCSFGFDILMESQEYRDNGDVIFHLEEVRLYEVSICTFPAYEDTGVTARKAELDEIRKRKNDAWAQRTLARLKGEDHGA